MDKFGCFCGDPACTRCYPGGNPDEDDDRGDGMLGASWTFANPERAAGRWRWQRRAGLGQRPRGKVGAMIPYVDDPARCVRDEMTATLDDHGISNGNFVLITPGQLLRWGTMLAASEPTVPVSQCIKGQTTIPVCIPDDLLAAWIDNDGDNDCDFTLDELFCGALIDFLDNIGKCPPDHW